MKTLLLFLGVAALTAPTLAQTYAPVAVTGYNLDAIAENSPASAFTTGSIDGSDYVLYTTAYGLIYSTGSGLPDNGTITNGTKSYQINPYTQNNTLYILPGIKDSLIFTNPTPYSALSLLATSTEGPGTLNVTVKFTDGTSQLFSNLSLNDWFNGSGSVISGIDRTGRSTDSPDYQFYDPSLYPVDMVLSCANRNKSVQKIVVQNTTGGSRICVFAVSAVALPTYSIATTNIICGGSANGSATLTVNDGMPSYSYTWTTTPAQNTATATNLSAGSYTATLKDPVGCTYTIATTITQQALTGTATITASSFSLCSGNSTTLTASGATSYTWSTSATTAATIITPTLSGTYSVAGTTSANCLITGSISITVNALPSVSFSISPNTFCSNSANVSLNGSPTGGIYSGVGVTGTTFSPVGAGIGTHTVSYSYTDTHGCSASAAVSLNVDACTGIQSFENITLSLYPNPNNGTFTITSKTGMDLYIHNDMGQIVMKISLNEANAFKMSINNLAKGIYVVSGQNAGTLIKQKLIITN